MESDNEEERKVKEREREREEMLNSVINLIAVARMNNWNHTRNQSRGVQQLGQPRLAFLDHISLPSVLLLALLYFSFFLMGATDSKLAFRKGVFRLFEEQVCTCFLSLTHT